MLPEPSYSILSILILSRSLIQLIILILDLVSDCYNKRLPSCIDNLLQFEYISTVVQVYNQ